MLASRIKRYRQLGLIAAGLTAAFVSGCFSLSLTLQNSSPRLASRLWPWNGIAEASLANRLILQSSVVPAARLARSALANDPAVASAARVLGFAADSKGRRGEALQWMRYVTALTRRDLGANLWLIEYYVARNDVPGALRIFDRTLRSTASSRDILFPILSKALADDTIARAALPIFRGEPGWSLPFFEYAIGSGHADANLVRIMNALVMNDRVSGSRALRAVFIQKLVERGRFDEAWSLYRRMAPRRQALPVRTGGDRDGNLPPLDWSTVTTDALTAEAVSTGLQVEAQPGGGGEIARQLLQLPAGRTIMTIEMDDGGNGAALRMTITLNCVGAGAKPLLNLEMTVGRAVSSVDVPATAQCRHQWLIVESHPNTAPEAQLALLKVRAQTTGR